MVNHVNSCDMCGIHVPFYIATWQTPTKIILIIIVTKKLLMLLGVSW